MLILQCETTMFFGVIAIKKVNFHCGNYCDDDFLTSYNLISTNDWNYYLFTLFIKNNKFNFHLVKIKHKTYFDLEHK